MNTNTSQSPSIAIIGAGMSGMLMAIKLIRAGKTNFTLFEKAKKIGGVWRENRYPGVACDVASFSYCYEFEPKSDWSRRFSGGGEIQAYFETVAKKYNLDKYLKAETLVTDATFKDGLWQVTTDKGETSSFTMLVDATGPLNNKIYPKIEGIEDFAGKMVHTADWDDDYDYAGKRVGIIRTPQWIMPTPNPHYSEFQKMLKRKFPFLGWMTRKFYDWIGEQFGRAALNDGWRRKGVAKWCESNLNSIKDETLREKLRPDHQAMCKRMIVSDVYYDALQQDNVHVERSDITKIEPTGVRTADGQLHELDMIVLATGFHPNTWGVESINGPNGVSLDSVWNKGEEKSRNYNSIGVPGLPNFFVLIGPNSPITNLSLIDIADIGVDYVMQCLEKIEAGEIKTMAPKSSAATAFGESLMTSFDDTIWVTGCSSWYFDGSSVPQTWPWAPSHFRERLKEPQWDHYEIT
jgi:cation diffusion facilitator CzcD-associated flavoprotein CzcO